MAYRDYQCTDCKHTWESFHVKLTEFDQVCPKCASENLLRLIGAPSLAFKGDGWWANDKHRYEPSKQISIGGGNTSGDIGPVKEVAKEWTPPGAPDRRFRD